ncbi:hypothetical protein VP01_2204g5 [Puccinia sorghi]|uniref:Uncharacterized protein n=1 Tax=Puccinia sorghi TaxID=27349 RepID=A0A0L6V8Z3_9BASI|nr:hypothetical protein VP01_2204g5 [Puccinia sorghi]
MEHEQKEQAQLRKEQKSKIAKILKDQQNQKNYTSLFGGGSKVLGFKQMTKAQAFEMFETWIKKLNPDLMPTINGKKKYMDVQNFEENTGAGIENKSGTQTLYNLLETKCPCYHCLNVLFQEKANVMVLFELNHSKPRDELRLLMDSNFKHEDGSHGF